MMRVNLPLGRPPITGYMHHMYPLSILAQDEAYLPWFHCHYIQLRQFAGRSLNFYLHPFHREFSACPLLESNRIDRRLADDKGGGITGFAIECIERGYYVQLDVDYFYVPGGPCYKKAHFLHELLLSGFDRVKGVFTASGYGPNGDHASYDVEFVDFEQSLSTTFADNPVIDTPAWLTEKNANPQVVLYRHRPEGGCAFDLEQAREEMSDLLHSRNTSERLRMLAGPRGAGDLWGLDTYQFLADLVERPEAAKEDPLISLRIFWEHKKCMAARLRYMEDRGLLPAAAGFSRAYADLASRANRIRLAQLKSRMGGGKRQGRSAFASEELPRLRDDEAALLGDALTQI